MWKPCRQGATLYLIKGEMTPLLMERSIRYAIERRQSEDRIRLQNTLQEGINRIFRESLLCKTEAELGRVCLSVAEELTRSQFGFLGMINAKGHLEDIAIIGPGMAGHPAGRPACDHKLTGFEIHGQLRQYLRQGKPFIINDPAAHSGLFEMPDDHPPLQSFMGAPFLHAGKTIGMVGLSNRKGGYRQEDCEAVEHLVVAIVQAFLQFRAEAALRRSEARWNAAIENFSEGAIIASEDEQVIYWNPAARTMHGFTRPDEGIEPLEKTPVTFQLWTLDGSHMLELDEWPMRRIKRGESVRDLELLIRRPDQGWGKVFSYSGAMVDTAGGERLIFLSCHDLTEQRQTEQALREIEQRFRLALHNAPVTVAAQDRDLRFIWAYNQRLTSQAQIIGHFDHEIFTPEEAAHFTAVKRRVLEEGIEQARANLDEPVE